MIGYAFRSVRKCERYGMMRIPSGVLEFRRTAAALKELKTPFSNHERASRDVPRESSRDSPRQGYFGGTKLPIGSACGPGNTHLPNATIASGEIAVLKNCQQQGNTVDSYAVMEVLKRCSLQKDLMGARQVHDFIIQNGMDKNPYVINTLINVFIRCGRLQDARRVFDGFEKKNVVTWNIMCAGYVKDDNVEDAMELFYRMRQGGAQPGELLCLTILKACASPSALKWGKEVHAYLRHAGLESDVRVGTALVQMYAKCGCIMEGRRIFDNLINRNVITWTVMIGAYTGIGCGEEAYRLFLQMKREGFIPNAFTYASILNAPAGALEWVKDVHSQALEAGHAESDLRVGNALVHTYAKSGSIGDAQLVFDRMEKRDVVTWTAMIGAYAKSGCGMAAYRLLLQMEREGLKANAITYLSILNPSASLGALEWVKEVHSHALKAGLDSDVRVGTALVHMYAKSGSIDGARLVFDSMNKLDVATWNTMIGGLAQHGRGHETLELFKKMNANRVKPNGITFVGVLCACSHAGLVDDGRRLLSAMKQDYGIDPDVVHYNCMVDLLGRAGHLEEAKLLIDNMQVEPDGITWKALLGACRTHCNVELAELAAYEVFKLEPNDAAAYVLLSNIYAATGKWEKVLSLREMMQKRGVRKEPGRSWIEIDNKIHEFVSGDNNHPETPAIYSVLQELIEKLKSKGYIPDTRLVLHNMQQEDKELAICSHSEKLAIAYGVLRVPSGKPIRVEKNLRFCSDCHAATKLISEVTGREIIAKDANRFHHFKDGVCSCGDYW